MTQTKALCAIPCYNESINLPALFKDLESSGILDICTPIFINDCSTDNTRDVVLQKGYRLIDHPTNLGYGGAVQTACRTALTEGYEYFVVFPGDHQRKADDARKLLEMIRSGQWDVAVGSKFHIYSQKYGPIRRRIGNRIFSWIARAFWRSPIEDVLSGFKAYRASCVSQIFGLLPAGYPFDIVFSYYASRHGLRLTETPVACRYDENTTKMRSVLLVSAKMFMSLAYHFLIASRFSARYRERPQTKSLAL